MDKAFRIHTDSFSEKASDFLSLKGFKALSEAPNATIFSLEAVKSGIKFLAGYVLFRQISPEAELLSVAMSPNSRKKGLGLQLLKAMPSYPESRSINRVFLGVSEQNLAATGLYKRAGFTRGGPGPDYYRSFNGPR